MQCFSFIPVWSTSCGMGGIPPSLSQNNTVILLCAISFLLNNDPDLSIFFGDCRRLVPLQEGQRAIQPQAQRLCDQAPIRRLEGELISQRAGERNRAHAVGRRGCGRAHHAGRRRRRRRQLVARNGPCVGHTLPLPPRRRWHHRPGHQASSPLLATAKLRSSLPLPLLRHQAQLLASAKLACAGGYTHIEII